MTAIAQARADVDLRATHAQLDQLEKGEWFRWSATLAITMAMTIGILVLSLPVVRRDDQLELIVRGLLAIVLLFDIFVIHQQILITRMRRQLTSQLNLIVSLDLLKQTGGSAAEDNAEGAEERRRLARVRFEQPLRVVGARGAKGTVQGRIRDITEDGLGAVIPEALEPGDDVTLEFIANGCRLSLKAVIKYRRGLQYGFQFVGLSDSATEMLRQIRVQQSSDTSQ